MLRFFIQEIKENESPKMTLLELWLLPFETLQGLKISVSTDMDTQSQFSIKSDKISISAV